MDVHCTHSVSYDLRTSARTYCYESPGKLEKSPGEAGKSPGKLIIYLLYGAVVPLLNDHPWGPVNGGLFEEVVSGKHILSVGLQYVCTVHTVHMYIQYMY
jgi:hypothetical protein